MPKEKKEETRCAHCNSPLHPDTHYCGKCGHKHQPTEPPTTCPTCKRTIHHSHTYCYHCGSHIKKKKKYHTAILLTITLILLLFLAFTILSSLQKPPTQDTTQSLFTEQPEAHIILTNLHCTPTPTTLRICGTTTWVGGSHAKAYIQGGIELQDLQAQYQQPFTSCQIIGYTEQPVTYTALLYDPSNNLLTSRTNIVTCPSPPQLPAQPYTHTKHLQFTTSSTNNRPDNSGVITVAFPDQLQSCTITGTYTFEDGGEKPGTKSYKSKQYCDGASGTFTGLLTPAYQSTVNDPHQFAWDDKQLTDPEPTTYLDYIIYARTCDTQYNLQERYFTSVRAIGLGTSTLDLYWNYKNDDTLPRVFFDTTFTCQLLPKP